MSMAATGVMPPSWWLRRRDYEKHVLLMAKQEGHLSIARPAECPRYSTCAGSDVSHCENQAPDGLNIRGRSHDGRNTRRHWHAHCLGYECFSL